VLNSMLQGKKNPSTDQEAVKSFLGLVKHAKEINIDRYCLKYRVHYYFLTYIMLVTRMKILLNV